MKNTSPIDAVLSSIDAKQTGPGKWLAKCPGHDDRTASLSIKHTDDDKVLIHCFAGCEVSDVLAAVGLEIRDLFPPKPTGHTSKRSRPPKFSSGEMLKMAVFESTLIVLAIRQLIATGRINEADYRRVERAIETIYEISAEVRHG